LIFIANYDYDIPLRLFNGASDLEICQLIDSRVDALQTGFSEQAREIQRNYEAFRGHYIPESTMYARKYDISKYEPYYRELKQLCQEISTSLTSENESMYRYRLIEIVDTLDLRTLFVSKEITKDATGNRIINPNDINRVPTKRICDALIKFIENEFIKREQIDTQNLRYL
jgi:hypothetical protein